MGLVYTSLYSLCARNRRCDCMRGLCPLQKCYGSHNPKCAQRAPLHAAYRLSCSMSAIFQSCSADVFCDALNVAALFPCISAFLETFKYHKPCPESVSPGHSACRFDVFYESVLPGCYTTGPLSHIMTVDNHWPGHRC